jgi:colanic acid biosynthesis protein WcaH
MSESKILDDNEFASVIRNAPLISIDLIVKNKKGEVLVGFRKNGPAKNNWFVPGGRVRKNEKLDDAFNRITLSELNQQFSRQDSKFLNIYEHLYIDENKYNLEGVDTHYVVIAYQIDTLESGELDENDQHSKFKWMKIEELLTNENVHQNTKEYF